MGQDNSKLLSKRRVEQVEKVKLLSTENQAAMKLSTDEIKTLKQLYHRLAALSPEDEYIDKQTFLNYFPLEGILAERLFSTFDKDKNNVIDYEEFLGGLALCLAGTVDEKFQLVFDLYNIDDGDGISEDELAVVLKSTLMAAKAIVEPNSTLDVGLVDELFDVDKHVKKVVHDAFEQCDTSQTGKLSPEEFRNWAERHSYILDIIFGHKSFTDKQKISENITAAAMKAAEINTVRCQTQTWVDSTSSENLSESYHGYSKATYLWSPVFPVMVKAPNARSEHTACVYQGALYVLGGRGACSALKDFWKYDLALNNWSELQNVGERPSHIFGQTAVLHKVGETYGRKMMAGYIRCKGQVLNRSQIRESLQRQRINPTDHQRKRADAVREYMYVYGGQFESSETFVWKYAFEYNEWEKIAFSVLSDDKVPMNRRYHSAVVYRNKMYVFGGLIDIRGSTDEFWSFDLVDHTWDVVGQLMTIFPGKRYEHSAVVYNKAMWIVGGLEIFTPKNDVWKWEFEKGVWCKIKTKGGPFPIRGHRAVRCGNYMLIYGGSSNGEHQNRTWRFEFATQSWSIIDPHGGISPSARSSAAVVILSAFSLPLLPPQMVNTTQMSSSNARTLSTVNELRPHTSPVMKCNQTTTSFLEKKPRHFFVSSDSLYQPTNVTSSDKRSSAGSVDLFSENFMSFTNASYSSSNEWKVGQNDIYPLHETLRDRSHKLERHEEEGPQSEEKAVTKKKEFRNENFQAKTRMGGNVDISQQKEGLCIFVVGGKNCGSQDFFGKSVDIWRCDITKRRKCRTKIRNIKVKTAEPGSSTVDKCVNSRISFNEPTSKFSGTSTPVKVMDSPNSSSRKLFSTACRRDVLKTSDMNEGTAKTYYGDLVVTDLGSSTEPSVSD